MNTLRQKNAVDDETDRLIALYGSPYLTVDQFREVVHISRNGAATWRREGTGPHAVRVGRKWLYSARGIAEYLHSR